MTEITTIPLEAQIDPLNAVRRLGINSWALIVIVLLSLVSFCFELLGISMLLPLITIFRSESPEALINKFPQLAELFAQLGLATYRITLLQIGTIIFSALIFRQVVVFWKSLFVAGVTQNVSLSLRRATLNASLSAKYSWKTKKSNSAFVTNIINEPPRIAEIVSVAGDALFLAIVVTGYAVLITAIDYRLSIMTGATIVFLLGAYRALYKAALRVGADYSKSVNDTHHSLGELLSGFREIKIFAAEKLFDRRLDADFIAIKSAVLRQVKISELLHLSFPPIFIGVMGGFVYLSRQFLDISPEVIGVFAAICIRLYPLLVSFTALKLRYQAFRPALSSYLGFLEEARAADASIPKSTLKKVVAPAELSLEQVSLKYEPTEDRPILNCVSVNFPAGSVTVVVGPSGGGKSSLIALLGRLYEPCSGKYMIDGNPVDDCSYADFRNIVAVVPQDSQLFEGTIRENLLLGIEREPSSEDIFTVLIESGAADFVPTTADGLAMRIESNGQNLSGGQRQRLAIARALLRNSQVLLMDEPTSALDKANEQILCQAILNRKHRATIVIASHGDSVLGVADQVCCIEKGQIVFAGSVPEYLENRAMGVNQNVQ